MITALQAIFTSIYNFFVSIWFWITEGVYDLAVWVLRAGIEFYTLSMLRMKLFALNMGWDVAKSIIIDMQLSQRLQGFWDLLPVDVAVNLSALRIPEGIGLILTAYVTRYVLRFIPGGGNS